MSNSTIYAPEPSAQLVSFVEQQIRKAWLNGNVERRSENRCHMTVPVLVQPVDSQHNATGDPFSVVTRDISPKGVGLMHSEPIDQTLLALQMTFADEPANLVAEVQWCNELGSVYYIGCAFVAQLASFPGS